MRGSIQAPHGDRFASYYGDFGIVGTAAIIGQAYAHFYADNRVDLCMRGLITAINGSGDVFPIIDMARIQSWMGVSSLYFTPQYACVEIINPDGTHHVGARGRAPSAQIHSGNIAIGRFYDNTGTHGCWPTNAGCFTEGHWINLTITGATYT